MMVHIRDVAGNDHRLQLDAVWSVDWGIPGMSAVAIRPETAPPFTTVTMTIKKMDGTDQTFTVRYEEVAYIYKHYGAILAANHEHYQREQRRLVRLLKLA